MVCEIYLHKAIIKIKINKTNSCHSTFQMPGTVISFIILPKCYNKYARKVLSSLFTTEKHKFRHIRELA